MQKSQLAFSIASILFSLVPCQSATAVSSGGAATATSPPVFSNDVIRSSLDASLFSAHESAQRACSNVNYKLTVDDRLAGATEDSLRKANSAARTECDNRKAFPNALMFDNNSVKCADAGNMKRCSFFADELYLSRSIDGDNGRHLLPVDGFQGVQYLKLYVVTKKKKLQCLVYANLRNRLFRKGVLEWGLFSRNTTLTQNGVESQLPIPQSYQAPSWSKLFPIYCKM